MASNWLQALAARLLCLVFLCVCVFFLTKKVNLLFFHLAFEVCGQIAKIPQLTARFLYLL